jgi:predicted naringenin-chalcone synthase
MRARLAGLATLPAPHRAEQRTITRFLARVASEHADPKDRESVARRVRVLAEKSAIDSRATVLSDYLAEDAEALSFYPKNWRLDPFPTTRERMAVFERESVELGTAAAKRALAVAKIPPDRVTHVVFTTCTGAFAPGPDVILLDRLELSRDVERTVIGFMGCYAGFAAMRTADRIARAEPDAVILVVSVELCSLHFQRTLDTETMIANTLFADGAAASLWTCAPIGETVAELSATRSRVPTGTLDRMSWRIGDHGFVMTLDGEVPAALEREAPAFARDLLQGSSADHYAVHPGGKKILDSVARALGGADLCVSREVLRDFGNMSSATIFFVLERLLAKSTGRIAALGFGPGLTMEGAVLER